MKTGETYEEIKKTAMEELFRIKHRVHQRMSYHRCQKEKRKRKRKEAEKDGDTDDEMVEEMSEEESLTLKEDIGTVEEFIDMGLVEDSNVSIIFTTKTEAEETDHEEEIQEKPTNENFDDDEVNYDFCLISNDEDLQRVTHQINTNPLYLKNLRLQIVEESQNGICTLQQIFTLEFLRYCNMFGTHDHKKLTDLVPYKAVYFCK